MIVEALLRIPERIDPGFQDQARRDVAALLENGATSLAQLRALVTSPRSSSILRRQACWALGYLGNKRSSPTLLSALDSNDQDVRWAATRALSQIGGRRATQGLLTFLRSGRHPDIRKAAAYALGWVGGNDAQAPLITTLQDTQEAKAVRGAAAEALANLGCREACAVLVTTLEDADPEVRFWSAFALGVLGDKNHLPALRRLADSDDASIEQWGAVSDEARRAISNIRKRGIKGSRYV